MDILKGLPASPGIAVGPAYLFAPPQAQPLPLRSQLSPREEHRRFLRAVEEAQAQLDQLYAKALREAGESAAQIFDIHKMMLDDLDFQESVAAHIREEASTAEHGVHAAAEELAQAFLSMDDETMRARSADIRDISQRLLSLLQGRAQAAELTQPSIVCARDLLPSDTMLLDREKVLAFATEQGSHASHAAILARTLGIPAVVGVPGLMEAAGAAALVVVDGGTGQVLLDPDAAALDLFRVRQADDRRERALLDAYRDRESVTLDGVRIEICANIAYPGDAELARRCGADGVGLMRSEFLYMDADRFPDEERQLEAYKSVLLKMEGRRVVVRTLDIGADKVPRYLDLPHEENPALGCRAIRLCLDRPELFRTQLRALLRASVYGRLAIMFPMIATLDELRRAKALLAACRRELLDEGTAVSDSIEVGMMVEIPAAAILSDLFAAEVDFFSIGTNDLTQYTLAADRLNDKVSPLFDCSNQALLRLIAHTAESAAAHGIWCGICGESAGDLSLLPFYAKAGIRELSVVPGRVLELRRALTELDVSKL